MRSGDETRVLLFTDADVFAGTERHMLDLARGLRGIGVKVAVACPSPSILGERAASEGFEHVAIRKGPAYDRAAIASLRDLLKSGRFNVIHAHNGRSTLSAALAVRSSKTGRCVATQHFISPNHAGHRGLKRFMTGTIHRWVNRHVHAHVAISQAVRTAAIARGELDPEDVHLVHNGITDPALEALIPGNLVRSEFGIAPGAPLVVCAARLEREKGLPDLFVAMQAVSRSFPSSVLLLAGSGAMRDELRSLARELSMGDRIHVIGFRTDALSLLAAADVVALPSSAEGFGLVIVEAMALGKPVVAIRAGGPMEIVVDGVTGRLTNPGDPASLAAAISAILSDAPGRESMGLAGRRRFEAQFTNDRMAREMSQVYRAAIG